MGSTAWMCGVLALALGGQCVERQPPGVTGPTLRVVGHAKRDSPIPVRRARFQSARSPSRLVARWAGQDGHDYVGLSEGIVPNDVPDIHIKLSGLDPGRVVASVEVTGDGGDQWIYSAKARSWGAVLKREGRSAAADLFFEPIRRESGRTFHLVVRYEGGPTIEAYVKGGKADPNVKLPGKALVAQWLGQESQDWVGPGPSVGRDGLVDVRIHLEKITGAVAVTAVRIEGPAGMRWQSGVNAKALANCEFFRDSKDATRGDLFFQPVSDLNAQPLKVMVLYENGKIDTAHLTARSFDPTRAVPRSPLPRMVDCKVTARWLGQDGTNPARPGAIHVALSGLPARPAVEGAVLSDSVKGTWVYRSDGRQVLPSIVATAALDWKLGGDGTSADLWFSPYRETAGDTYTLRLAFSDGASALVRFAGETTDMTRLEPPPDSSRATASPGDDLQALVNRHGTVVLSPGTYRLSAPLVLGRAVTLTSDGGATLRFAQPATDRPWTTAIKILRGNTTLDGFAVRFDGAVRWNNDVGYRAAVIGMTDSLDPGYGDPKWNVVLTRLDLEEPAVEPKTGWVESARLMRLVTARNGVIAHNILRGGPIEFFGGPWRIEDNEFRGAVAGTYSHGVFTGHDTHDVVVRGNRTRAVEPAGKTWRFLVFTGTGHHHVVANNVIEQVGARDDDTIPWSNAPEIILTESYHVKYEGSLAGRSADGRVVRTGFAQWSAGATGDVLALLDGPSAGEWRRILQPLDATAFLLDRAIPDGTKSVSIVGGFVDSIYEHNRINLRGGRKSSAFVLAGNHFGTRIVKNHVAGGDYAFRITAAPTEAPLGWGWTHAPFLQAVVDGNRFEDAARGMVLGVEHDARYIKTNVGRTYMSARLSDNVVVWSAPFLRETERAGFHERSLGFSIGWPPSHDAGELIVTAQGNRLERPAGGRSIPALYVDAAVFNARRVVTEELELTTNLGNVSLGQGGANGRSTEGRAQARD